MEPDASGVGKREVPCPRRHDAVTQHVSGRTQTTQEVVVRGVDPSTPHEVGADGRGSVEVAQNTTDRLSSSHDVPAGQNTTALPSIMQSPRKFRLPCTSAIGYAAPGLDTATTGPSTTPVASDGTGRRASVSATATTTVASPTPSLISHLTVEVWAPARETLRLSFAIDDGERIQREILKVTRPLLLPTEAGTAALVLPDHGPGACAGAFGHL